MSNLLKSETTAPAKTIKPPSKLLLATEGGRALFELGLFYLARPRLKNELKSDGHPVMVLPGYLASSISTIPLRNFLNEGGYAAYDWGIGRNMGKQEYLETLSETLKELVNKHQQKVTLIGWSLGGVFSRELARANPELVRQVITLGSPFGGITEVNNVTRLYEWLSGREIKELDEELAKEIVKSPPVPTTAIYSKYDGVVQWQHCMEATEDPQTQNIEVLGSHFGLGHNPLVLKIISDRLAQPADNWKKYEAGKKD